MIKFNPGDEIVLLHNPKYAHNFQYTVAEMFEEKFPGCGEVHGIVVDAADFCSDEDADFFSVDFGNVYKDKSFFLHDCRGDVPTSTGRFVQANHMKLAENVNITAEDFEAMF